MGKAAAHLTFLRQQHITSLQNKNRSEYKSFQAAICLAQAQVETNLKCQENAMMLIKVHKRKGNIAAADEAYEQITELQREMKVLK